MKHCLHYIELGWHILTLVLLTSAFFAIWIDIGDLSLINVIIQITWIILLVNIPLIGLHLRKLKIIIKKGWNLWAFLSISLLSLFWSQYPFLSLKASLLLIFLTLYGYLLAIRYPFFLVLRLIGIAMAIIVSSSLITITMGMEWAFLREVYKGAWQGVMHNRNLLGSISATSFIVFISIASQTQQIKDLIMWYLLASITLVLVIGSKSVTALISLVCAFIIWVLIKGFVLVPRDARFPALAVTCCFVVPLGLLGVLYWPEITALLGRESTLSGRVYLWQALFTVGNARPLLGNGYGTFGVDWGAISTIEVAMMNRRFPWASHAHDGYLEVWLELGIVGLVFFLWSTFSLFFYSLTALFTNKTRFGEYDFLVLFLLFLFLNNLTESLLGNIRLFSSYFWVIFSWMYCFVIIQRQIRK